MSETLHTWEDQVKEAAESNARKEWGMPCSMNEVAYGYSVDGFESGAIWEKERAEKAAALPVESRDLIPTWDQIREKLTDILYENNGTPVGLSDIMNYLQELPALPKQ